MKILVTGGSGFLGINLIRHLHSKNCQIRSLDIVEFDYADMNDKIEIITGDIRNKDTVDKAVDGVDIVIHSAAALPLYTPEEIFSTDIDGTKNLLDAADKFNVDRFIHISSTAVYGIPDHHPLYEDDKLDGVGPYGKAKIQAEEKCLNYRDKGICVSIIRPKSFVGPERLGVFDLLFDWAKDGRAFPMIGKGNNRYQLLDVEDLCEAIYSCCTLVKEKVNDIFNIGAKEYTTMKEDYQAVLDYAGHGKKIKGLPEKPIILILKFLEALKISPLYKWVYETASKDSFVSIEKAEKQLNYKPKYSNKDALIRNYKWYVDNHEKFKNKSGISHRVPWKQGILRVAKIFF
ncbi:MAG: NAD-dependent epimerase/dehydratase family protein [Ignavibacteria bacterium]|nr:NAD-dependent epimerase/dehydratase family protein [Ignavibacteria bacterium]MBT8383208.1 NAD-dependent epimerase/dehydratase family protein [Ignavibacteria bacterium]MBT8392798.1 NAD-dependent epimerase/dehydratase family protein [Ignavibacteria bacterium]NNJ54359.1 NAD-dependent epimerase/dehydratase family protein [Ignavibacteriaceae bacterium]NNL20524.1 NAD-dependent epimerase/dehydratase family protein [Ignavibacteriaceae bacterium]